MRCALHPRPNAARRPDWARRRHQPPQSVLEELLPAAGSSVTVGWEEVRATSALGSCVAIPTAIPAQFFHSVLRHPHTCGLLTPGP